MNSILDQNPLLFGHHPDAGLLGVEHLPGEASDEMELFYRAGVAIVRKRAPFQPFLWVTEAGLLSRLPFKVEIRELAGSNDFRYLARCSCWREFDLLLKMLRAETGSMPGDTNAPYFHLNDPVHQFLLQTGRTSFKNMRLQDLRRFQLTIVAHKEPEFEFPNADRVGDRILAIGMADSTGWSETISDLPEKEIIQRWMAVFRERDPDVLEGHNVFKFDLPYLLARARRCRIKVELGRDGSRPRVRASRFMIADQSISYSRAEIFGRHVIDTCFLVQAYDVSQRALESYELEDTARHLGIDCGPAEPVPGANPRAVAERQVLAVRALGDLLSPSYFTQAQLLPFGYQSVCTRGTGMKIDSLMLREYLRQDRSIPRPGPARPFEGGYTDVFVTGLARNVHHCDIRSLYPSLMLAGGIGPRADELSVFLTMLKDLREFRVQAKARMQTASAEDRGYLGALQTTFKILINSFYGYLGFSQGHFNDYDAAERITAEGRAVLRSMIDWLKGRGAIPVEIDTDGVYFIPPPFASESDRNAFRAGLQSILPAGLDVEFDGEYRAMFSHKMKNYALLEADGNITIRGAALKSRGLEPFQRDYLRDWLRLVLEDRTREIPSLRQSYRAAIEQRQWPIAKLAKTETLQDAPSTYAAKIGGKSRGRNAAYELALKSGRDYRAGDSISYYVTGAKKSVAIHEAAKPVAEWNPAQRDENVPYYLAKLDALIEKFDTGNPDENESHNQIELPLS